MANKTNWLPVRGFEGLYVVSYGGFVKSLRTGKRLKTFKNEKKYVCVNLTDKHGVVKKRKLHRLVAIAHIPNPENKSDVNHLRQKWDCRACSLEWLTHQENIDHAHRTGLMKSNKGKKYKTKNNGRNKPERKRRRKSSSDQKTFVAAKRKAATQDGSSAT